MCQGASITTRSGGEEDKPPTKENRSQNAMGQASFLSRLLFIWPYPLLKLGLERPLEERDLPENLEIDTSLYNRNHFESIWAEEKTRHPKNPNLHRALLADFLKSVWYVQPAMMAAMIAKVVQALALGLLIESFETGNGQGYKWAALLVGCGMIVLFEHHHVFFITWRKGMQIRISCIAAIYSKSLRLSSTHQETSASTGKIMNLASNDVERFLLASLFVSYLFWSPIQAIAILIVGWLSLGPAFAAGFALLAFGFVPLQFYLGRRFAYFRSKIASITDRRVTFVSQAVNGARVMKMSGYEWRFLDRIQEIRKEEVTQIMLASKLKAWNEACFFMSNVVISLVIFLVHVFIGGTLTPRDVFTVFTLINVLQLEMTKHVSLGVMGVSECYVSISRIQNFLEFPELIVKTLEGGKENTEEQPLPQSARNQVAISMSDMSCYWNEVQRASNGLADDSDSALVSAISNSSIDFRMGELTCLIGAVGSGKSALLQAIVGELPVASGSLDRSCETIGYAAQDPWIMDGTVQANIVMGLDFDQEWYNQVVNACALAQDFSQFQNGDMTIVGDRGVQCSGGQRSRIGLAR
jgi:ATP-binding cassette subfamily C (CFTR/MRP) protein 4